MPIRRALPAALTVSAMLAVPAVAAAPAKVTDEGVGKVKLGATHASLHKKGLVGHMVRGCELAGPGQKAARLKAPLRGAVNLTRSKPRRVDTILVTKGAAAEGVGIGDTKADIKAAFPHAKFDSSGGGIFGVVIATVPKRDGGRFQFGIDTGTKKIRNIGVPIIPFCE
jgi:hypothetical protein